MVCDVESSQQTLALVAIHALQLDLNEATISSQTNEPMAFLLLCAGTAVSYRFCLLHDSTAL